MAIERLRLRFSTSATRPRANQGFEVLSRETLLLHAELDRLDGIGPGLNYATF